MRLDCETAHIHAAGLCSVNTDSNSPLSGVAAATATAGLQHHTAVGRLWRRACPECLQSLPCADADEIDFDGFLRMLRVGSVDHLDQYESRHQSSASQHGGAHFGDLSTVAE